MLFNAQDKDFEQRIRDSFSRQAFMKTLGAKLGEIRAGYCEIEVPFKKELTQQHEFLHAGVIGTIADTSAGYAAFSLFAADSTVLTVEYKLNLMSPGDGEKLIAKSQVLKYGKTLTICRSDVFVVKNGIEKICAAAQVTLIELSNRKDA